MQRSSTLLPLLTTRHRRAARPVARSCLLILLTFVALAAAETYATTEEALARAYPEADRIEPVEPELSADQARAVIAAAESRARGRIGATYLAERDGRALGVAFVDHVIGRTEFITWLCALDADGSIRRMEVLVYREPYGSEIRSREWLQRFHGHDFDDPPRLRHDVPNISGATLSCQAIVDRSRFLLAYHRLVLTEQIPGWLPPPRPGAVIISEPPSPVQRAAVIGRPVLQIRLAPGAERAATQDLADEALAAAQRVDAVLNTWSAESELAQAVAAGEAELSPAAAAFVDLAAELHAHSGGRFDPTLRPLVELWAAAGAAGDTPSEEALAAARARVGFAALDWDPATRRLVLPTGTSLDSSALLKGFVVDAAAAVLRAEGARGTVDFGTSSLAAVGAPTTVALRDPDAPMQLLGRFELPADHALASSGTYHQRWQIDGRSRSHLIDPVTGQALAEARAASVIAPTAALADGLATACCLLAPAEALALVARHPGAELWLWDAGEIHTSAGWPDFHSAD